MTDIPYLTAEIVASAAANEHSRMRPEDLVDLIKSVRSALAEDSSAPASPTAEKAPAMTKSQWSKLITPAGITSLLDGKSYKTLKRHLATRGHDPQSYRVAHGLPSDFPMTSPDYSAARSAMAKSLGLGGKGRKASPKAESPKRGRKAS